MKKNWDWERFEKDFVSKATYKENGSFKTVLNPERTDLPKGKYPLGIIRKFFYNKKVKYFSIAFIFILSLELALLIFKIV